MIFFKKFSQEEVLKALAILAVQTLPENLNGEIILSFNDDGGVEITIIEDPENDFN